MITYSRIGNFGRLGNQLFQFASTYGIAKAIGADVCFPIENISNPVKEHFKDGLIRHISFYVPKYFEFDESLLKPISKIPIEYEYQERYFHFCEDAFRIPNDYNIDIRGYYQSEKYFKHCEDDIRRLLRFKDTQKDYEFPIDLNNGGTYTSIHVRLGDYLGLQEFHPVLGPEYYSEAVSMLYNETDIFLVFSDNIDLCKQMFPEDSKIWFIECGSDIDQLEVMSQCKNNIIANSSYSWWAAWLNQSEGKKIIAPKNWFGPMYRYSHDTKDLYCENWIVI